MREYCRLSQDEWDHHYALENALLNIHRQEEAYWQLRGELSWLLKGDAITTYFFSITNGRLRRCSIYRLINDGAVGAVWLTRLSLWIMCVRSSPPFLWLLLPVASPFHPIPGRRPHMFLWTRM